MHTYIHYIHHITYIHIYIHYIHNFANIHKYIHIYIHYIHHITYIHTYIDILHYYLFCGEKVGQDSKRQHLARNAALFVYVPN